MGGESGGRDDEKAEVDGQFIDKGSSSKLSDSPGDGGGGVVGKDKGKG